jgi:signal transduction histidine kinase
MEVQPGSLYLAVLSLSTAVCGFMAYLAVRNQDRRGARAFAALVVCLLVWTLMEVVALLSAGPREVLVANQVKYLAVPFVPVTIAMMALRYTGSEQYISRTTLGLATVIPVVSVLVMLTNQHHGLFWTSTQVETVGAYSVLVTTSGPWYLIHLLYSYLLLVVGTVTLIRWALRAGKTYQRQARLILIGIAVPWAANVAEHLAIDGTPLDPTPVFFTVSGVFIGVAILRFQFLDLTPVARNTVVEVMREGLVVVDDEGRIIDANPAARTLLGRESPVGENIAELTPTALADACLGESAAETLTMTTPTGERTFDVRRSELPGGARMVLLYDVTERRRQAGQLERQNERLERFGSVLAHDLRNPLNVAQGYVEMLVEEGEETDHVRRAIDALDRMEELIDGTLALTREGPAVTEPEPVDLGRVAREAWESVDTAGATLELRADLTVSADPARLQRLFENLFRNAVEHRETAGRWQSDEARAQRDNSAGLTVWVEPITNGFAVADDGPGIPEEMRESVLEFGFSSDENGTGLGLSIVTEIAEAHGWRVEVAESETGGARFEFRGVAAASGRETP